MSAIPLAGKVCIVTGATRGIGKGIALQLAEKGGKIYITGRTLDPPKGSGVGGSLRDTVDEIKARGGTCIPVQCDHSKDADIERLFDQVKRENEGRLDVLVNNAYSANNDLLDSLGATFWEISTDMWDNVNIVGLRNHYMCSVYAARMMVPRKRGLIVNVSSAGGLRYMFNVAYGIGKEACDRMAADCGYELKKHNVAFVSLWPGLVATETALYKFNNVDVLKHKEIAGGLGLKQVVEQGETIEFTGQCVAALANDPDIMKVSGKTVLTCDLARKYGLKDKEGRVTMDITQVNVLLNRSGHSWLAYLVPNFVRIPKWLLALGGNKFA
ncbi:Dehydrogenase reductase SDR member [Mactra antiquata]